MSLTYTVTDVKPDYNDWAGTDQTGPIRYFKFNFRDSDGGVGEGSFGRKIQNGTAAAPAVGYEFVASSAVFDEQHNSWKFKGAKSPEQAAKYGSGGGGSTAGADKMRSKEQCIRGEASIAAASLAKSADEAMSYAPRFEAYITNGGAAPPTATPAQAALSSTDDIPF